MNAAFSQLDKEIRYFYRISILNIVFAGLAMAYGITYIIIAITGQEAEFLSPGLRALTGLLAMGSFGLGLGWLVSSTRVFTGVAEVRGDLGSPGGTGDETRVTCLIVRMLAHYRENRATIRTMILVCTAGGCVLFLLGIANSLEALAVTGTAGAFTLNAARLIPPVLFSFGIATASLLSSHCFSKIAKTWDRRLTEIDESECTLKKTLGLDEA